MALMKALSKELAPAGIRVNAVLIGLVESGQWVRVAEGSGLSLDEFYKRFSRMPASRSVGLGAARSSPTWDVSCFPPERPTSPGSRSTSMEACPRPSEFYSL